MNEALTKEQRILEELKYRGEEGLPSWEAIKYGGWRYAARINDLKRKGYQIKSVPERIQDTNMCRYFLIERNYGSRL